MSRQGDVMRELHAVYGRGPEGAKCGTCSHLSLLWASGVGHPKCSLRRIAHSAQSDHWKTTAACGKYEEKQ